MVDKRSMFSISIEVATLMGKVADEQAKEGAPTNEHALNNVWQVAQSHLNANYSSDDFTDSQWRRMEQAAAIQYILAWADLTQYIGR